MKKALVLLALALLVLPVYAVLIELSSSSIDQIGGTGLVEVNGPGSVSGVKWILTNNAPYRVNAVKILWTPANVNSEYTVYVTIYDNNDNVKAYGSAGDQRGSGTITTEIELGTNVDPKDICKVEVIIVEE
ncbi:MAG: hypothetical protein QXG35_09855 [Nitrososphaerota archaeon]